MVSSTVFIFAILLTTNICFADHHHKTEQVSKTNILSGRLTSSTGLPDVTTRGPHTHEEHPVDDPDHSDHTHEEELKAAQPSKDDHDHSGHDHDHSAQGHDHSAQEHDHSAQGHDHSAQEHDHSAQGHDHSAHDHDHSVQGHDHSAQGHDHSAHDHDHPGHDHSETGHDHAEDHKEEAKLSLPPEEPKKEEEVPKVGEYKGNRARRGLWRRRLD